MTGQEIQKPWGKEIILELNEHYCIKLLEINAKSRLSLQYHNKKRESVYVLAGNLIDLDNHHKTGSFATYPPKTIHRFQALDSSVKLLEVSTPELDDVIRLEDDWGRGSNE